MTDMTDRLSPSDAGFLYTEDVTTPMHVGGVVILQPNRADFDYSDIFELIRARLSLVPRYRQKVRFVPGRIARPVWVDDEDFDLTYHVRRSALPRPGTDAQLADLVGRLISRPLDRTRPLWEMYVVEGLAHGRIALVNKTHHSMVDKVGAVDVAAAILDISAQPRPLPEQVWLPTPAPSDVDLVVDAIADITSRPSEILEAAKLTALDVRAAALEMGQAISGMFRIASRTVRPAPRSALNVTVSGQRRFVGVQVRLADIKEIRKAHGGTINDIILTIITGALRSFLLSRGEPVLPGTMLRAMVPMSVRQPPSEANVVEPSDPVASYLLDLPVAEPNPVMRLHQVSFAMAAHTESGQGVGADSLMELGRFAPPTLHALGARVGSGLSRRLYNVLITNVPGPQIPLYAAGAPVVAMYPVAPLAKGQALALSVTSYNGGVFFGLTADWDAMQDIEDFGEQITESLEELRATSRKSRRTTVASPVAADPAAGAESDVAAPGVAAPDVVVSDAAESDQNGGDTVAPGGAHIAPAPGSEPRVRGKASPARSGGRSPAQLDAGQLAPPPLGQQVPPSLGQRVPPSLDQPVTPSLEQSARPRSKPPAKPTAKSIAKPQTNAAPGVGAAGQSTPKQSTPKQSTPKQSTPKQSTPKQSTPKQSTPKPAPLRPAPKPAPQRPKRDHPHSSAKPGKQ